MSDRDVLQLLKMVRTSEQQAAPARPVPHEDEGQAARQGPRRRGENDGAASPAQQHAGARTLAGAAEHSCRNSTPASAPAADSTAGRRMAQPLAQAGPPPPPPAYAPGRGVAGRLAMQPPPPMPQEFAGEQSSTSPCLWTHASWRRRQHDFAPPPQFDAPGAPCVPRRSVPAALRWAAGAAVADGPVQPAGAPVTSPMPPPLAHAGNGAAFASVQRLPRSDAADRRARHAPLPPPIPKRTSRTRWSRRVRRRPPPPVQPSFPPPPSFATPPQNQCSRRCATRQRRRGIARRQWQGNGDAAPNGASNGAGNGVKLRPGARLLRAAAGDGRKPRQAGRRAVAAAS